MATARLASIQINDLRDLVSNSGTRAGRGLKQLSREFGVSANAIRIWVQRSEGDTPPTAARSGEQLPLSAAERQELVELRRRLKQVQMERDILAKATAWFAGKSERTSTTSSNS